MKDIPNFPDYKITEDGDIYSYKWGWNGRLLKKSFNKAYGYYSKQLVGKDGNKVHCLIHRLVAMTYKSLPDYTDLEVNHIDGNKLNNHISNLEWVTKSRNIKHAFELGLNSSKGEDNGRHILKESDVLDIYDLLSKGVDMVSIANKFNVHPCTVKDIKTKKNWNYLLKDLPDLNIKPKKASLSEDTVIKVCILLEGGADYRTILDSVNDPLLDTYKIYDIIRGKSFKRISKDFSFQKQK